MKQTTQLVQQQEHLKNYCSRFLDSIHYRNKWRNRGKTSFCPHSVKSLLKTHNLFSENNSSAERRNRWCFLNCYFFATRWLCPSLRYVLPAQCALSQLLLLRSSFSPSLTPSPLWTIWWRRRFPCSIQMVQPLAIPSLKASRNAQMTRQDPQDTKASAKQGNAIRRANDPVRMQMQRTVKQWLSHYLRLITAFCSPALREHLFLQSWAKRDSFVSSRICACLSCTGSMRPQCDTAQVKRIINSEKKRKQFKERKRSQILRNVLVPLLLIRPLKLFGGGPTLIRVQHYTVCIYIINMCINMWIYM